MSRASYALRPRITPKPRKALLVEALARNRGLLSARLELARLLLESGNWKNAHSLLEVASVLERQTPMCRFYYAGALIAATKWDEARQEVNLASAYLKSGDRVKAQSEYDIAVKLDPKSPERAALNGQFVSN